MNKTRALRRFRIVSRRRDTLSKTFHRYAFGVTEVAKIDEKPENCE